ncbi:MAG: shikimate kinase [Ruminococcaceae bacterium]|nr:shikimate kinase [Oscillospiraceae bacterium]
MKLVLIFGSAAVGKMSVGQELMKQTGLRLFHNHMAIEPVIEVLGYYDNKTIYELRDVFFRAFSQSDNDGMIFTFMWAFDRQEDWDYVAHVTEIFKNVGSEIYYVELVANQETRLQRNETTNRLANKASKRNLEQSRQRLLHDDQKYRLQSNPGEIPFENYIRIDNTHLEPDAVAHMIREHFAL